jgi:hypothetical protein
LAAIEADQRRINDEQIRKGAEEHRDWAPTPLDRTLVRRARAAIHQAGVAP